MQGAERRQALISNPALQRRLLIGVSWPVLLLISGNSALLLVLLWHTSSRQLDWLYAPLVLGVGLLALAGGFFLVNTLRISNQVLGPLVRIERMLDEYKEGRRQRIKLRKGDFLVEFADEINDLLEWFEEQQDVGRRDASRAEATEPERVEP